jgi:hypothetical protein
MTQDYTFPVSDLSGCLDSSGKSCNLFALLCLYRSRLAELIAADEDLSVFLPRDIPDTLVTDENKVYFAERIIRNHWEIAARDYKERKAKRADDIKGCIIPVMGAGVSLALTVVFWEGGSPSAWGVVSVTYMIGVAMQFGALTTKWRADDTVVDAEAIASPQARKNWDIYSDAARKLELVIANREKKTMGSLSV